MSEHFDLTEILKGCPEGTKFYSTIFGDVEFMCITDIGGYSIVLKARDDYKVCVDSEGKYLGIYNGECILFPSREQRSWSKFTAPWYKKEKLVELKESDDEKIRRWIIDDIRYNINNEPLNNSEYKKKAEKAIAWLEKQGKTSPILSNSSNTGKNEQKFDPKTLKAFDKVLVRDCLREKWSCGFFSHIVVFDDTYKYNVGEVLYAMCIPYNDETKHLVGTTEEAPEFYKYWED